MTSRRPSFANAVPLAAGGLAGKPTPQTREGDPVADQRHFPAAITAAAMSADAPRHESRVFLTLTSRRTQKAVCGQVVLFQGLPHLCVYDSDVTHAVEYPGLDDDAHDETKDREPLPLEHPVRAALGRGEVTVTGFGRHEYNLGYAIMDAHTIGRVDTE